jgi:hypothetical protein
LPRRRKKEYAMNHRILAMSVLAMAALGLSVGLAASTTPAWAAAAPMPAAPVVQAAAVARVQAADPGAYPLRCTVTASNVNYRRGPGTQYASYGQLPRGFTFASQGALPNPRIRLQYWDNAQRPGRADAWVDDAFVNCVLAYT